MEHDLLEEARCILFGFARASRGYTIVEVIKEVLTKDEWIRLKESGKDLFLKKEDIAALDEHFKL